MIEVVKAILEKNGKILLIKRSLDSKFFPNLWDLPGGKIEPEEDSTSALVRETEEETSLKINSTKKLGEYQITEQDIPIHFQVFKVETFEGRVQLSKDHTDSIWISKTEMNNYELAPIVKLFFKIL